MIDRGAAHDREHPVSVAQRVGEPLEHRDTATLTADESVGGGVEGMAGAGWRHRFGRIEAARHGRREHQVHPCGDRQLGLAGPQALAGQVHRDQRRRAGGVNGERRSPQVQEVGEPIGDDAQRTAGARPGVDLAEVTRRHVPVFADARAGEDPGLRALERFGRDAGMLERLDGDLEQ